MTPADLLADALMLLALPSNYRREGGVHFQAGHLASRLRGVQSVGALAAIRLCAQMRSLGLVPTFEPIPLQLQGRYEPVQFAYPVDAAWNAVLDHIGPGWRSVINDYGTVIDAMRNAIVNLNNPHRTALAMHNDLFAEL